MVIMPMSCGLFFAISSEEIASSCFLASPISVLQLVAISAGTQRFSTLVKSSASTSPLAKVISRTAVVSVLSTVFKLPNSKLPKGFSSLEISARSFEYLNSAGRVCSENTCPSKARKPAELEIELLTIVWTKPIMDGQAASISAICSAGCSPPKLVLRINDFCLSATSAKRPTRPKLLS